MNKRFFIFLSAFLVLLALKSESHAETTRVSKLKRPILIVRPDNLDFGQVAAGEKKQLRIKFRNRSKKKSIRVRLRGLDGTGYSVKRKRFRLEAGKSRRVRVILQANLEAVNSHGQATLTVRSSDPVLRKKEIPLKVEIEGGLFPTPTPTPENIPEDTDLILKVDQAWGNNMTEYQILWEVNDIVPIIFDQNNKAVISAELPIVISGGGGSCDVSGSGTTQLDGLVTRNNGIYNITIVESWDSTVTVCCGELCVPPTSFANESNYDFELQAENTMNLGEPGYSQFDFTLTVP